MSPRSYAVTRRCNSQSQHWRGKLRGYAVARLSYMCACAGAGRRVPVRLQVWVCEVRATVQPRNSLGLARVCELRVRATA